MRHIVFCIGILLFVTSLSQAADASFPKIGATYQIISPNLEGYILPGEVTILEKGPAMWCYVQFNGREKAVKYFKDLQEFASAVAGADKSEKQSPKTPYIVKERLWMNFALVTAAEEIPVGR